MRRGKRITLTVITVVAGTAALMWGVRLWLEKSPLVVLGGGAPEGELFDSGTAVGRVFADVQACGEQQKNLYGCIEAYRERYGRVPENMEALVNGIRETMSFRSCPAGLSRYVVHFENYGRRDAVLIEEAENKHRSALKLWVRGIKPQVQTMGDGTIYLFEGGKLATINARKK